MIETLSSAEIQKFIEDHLYDDPVALMLKASSFPHLPMKEVVEQITSKRKAKSKLPDWFQTSGIIYPPGISMEQCSSQVTAEYKASLVSGSTMVDLTGGFGVDTCFLARSFEQAHYVERQPHLVTLAKHNFYQLGAGNVSCHQGEAAEFLRSLEASVDLIYLDPARRGDYNRKVFRLEDCEPNVLELLPEFMQKSTRVMMKASPMLDIKGALADLGGATEVHVVADHNEVKELLFLIDSSASQNPEIHCINFTPADPQTFDFNFEQETAAEPGFGEVSEFLYEPNAAILKAGAFSCVAKRFGLTKLHKNTHLYTSSEPVANFPGRIFRVLDRLGMNKKELRRMLPGMKANITVRNFPMTVAQIRKKTGLREGGEDYVIATSDIKGPKVFHCQRF